MYSHVWCSKVYAVYILQYNVQQCLTQSTEVLESLRYHVPHIDKRGEAQFEDHVLLVRDEVPDVFQQEVPWSVELTCKN